MREWHCITVSKLYFPPASTKAELCSLSSLRKGSGYDFKLYNYFFLVAIFSHLLVTNFPLSFDSSNFFFPCRV